MSSASPGTLLQPTHAVFAPRPSPPSRRQSDSSSTICRPIMVRGSSQSCPPFFYYLWTAHERREREAKTKMHEGAGPPSVLMMDISLPPRSSPNPSEKTQTQPPPPLDPTQIPLPDDDVHDWPDEPALIPLPSSPSLPPSQSIPDRFIDLDLGELARQLRLQRFHVQHVHRSRAQLQTAQIATAINARFVLASKAAFKGLADALRREDSAALLELYDVLHEVRTSCRSLRDPAPIAAGRDLTVPRPSSSSSSAAASSASLLPASFLAEIPPAVSAVLLHFLAELRANPDFLPARLASLSSGELAALTVNCPSFDPFDPLVLPRSLSKDAGPLASPDAPWASPVGRLLALQRHDPLAALLHTVHSTLPQPPGSAASHHRIEIWSRACARLITERKAGSEAFTLRVLDAWADLDDWGLQDELDLYLRDILQDGAFLQHSPDHRIEDPRTRLAFPAIDSFTAAEAFYDRAVFKLFELLDCEAPLRCMPLTTYHLALAVLDKVPDKALRDTTRAFMLGRWLFSAYLPTVLIFPETHGLLLDHHISAASRHKILREVAQRAQKLVLDILYKRREPSSIPLDLRVHVEGVLSCMWPSPQQQQQQRSLLSLAPAGSSSFPSRTLPDRTTPFLVLSPADMITLVYALYPLRRSAGGYGEETFKLDVPLPSSASSISSVYNWPGKSSSGDASSVLSAGGTSMTSQTVFRDTLPDDESHTPRRGEMDPRSATPGPSDKMTDAETFEELGPPLHQAILELCQSLGGHATSGSCPPAEERWTVLVPTAANNGLQVAHALDTDGGLWSSLLQLPTPSSTTAATGTPSVSFSVTDERDTAALKAMMAVLLDDDDATLSTHQSVEQALLETLQARLVQSQLASDFLRAHRTFLALQLLRAKASSSQQPSLPALMHMLGTATQSSTEHLVEMQEQHTAWFTGLDGVHRQQRLGISQIVSKLSAFRHKAWYATDVVHSLEYDDARSVMNALRSMDLDEPEPSTTTTSSRSSHSSNIAGFIRKTSQQILELFAAPTEHGGRLKLSDDQVTITKKYLATSGVENFCPGEERIHRFNSEVDKLANRLIGRSIIDGPVLWASDLYRAERDLDRLQALAVSPTTPSYPSAPHAIMTRSSNSLAARTGGTQPMAMHHHHPTQTPNLSHGSSSYGSLGHHTPSLLNSGISLRTASPSVTSTATNSFTWSPAPRLSQSPTATMTTNSPATTSSTGLGIRHSSPLVDSQKQRFLDEVRQALISLALSDFGSHVFAMGCETDQWLTGELANDCLNRQNGVAPAPDAGTLLHDPAPSELDVAIAAPTAPTGSAATIRSNASVDFSSTKRDNMEEHSSAEHPTTGEQQPDFPFRTAYRVLLRRFACSSSPVTKVQALVQLEQVLLAGSPVLSRHPSPRNSVAPIVADLQSILRDPELRPRTLFRDLQFVAAFSPQGSLDKTPQGQAFFNVAIAALGLKHEMLSAMLKRADDIVAFYTSTRSALPTTGDSGQAGSGHTFSPIPDSIHSLSTNLTSGNSNDPMQALYAALTHEADPNGMTHYTLHDAGRMLVIAAKEGDPVGQRELATLYLTHPDLVPRCLAPLIRPRDVFKPELTTPAMPSGTSAQGATPATASTTAATAAAGGGGARFDALTMSVAHHWMERAARGGDALAKEFLRGTEEGARP